MNNNNATIYDASDDWFDYVPQEEEAQKSVRDPEAAKHMQTYRLMSLEEIESLPDPEWLVKDMLPMDSFTVLFGPPGSTKSMLTLDIACCIASGLPFNNNEVKPGKVVYFVAEGLRGLKWRIEAWKLAHPEADHESLYKNLVIVPDAPKLLEKSHAGMLINTADFVHTEELPLRLFIIDTWARSLVGGDENSAQDAGIAIDVCDRVRKNTGATALIVHHTGADGTRERGSTALRAAADSSISVTHDEVQRMTTVQVKKMKDGESGQTHRFSLHPFGHSVVLKPNSGLTMNAYNALTTDPDVRPNLNAMPYQKDSGKSRSEWAKEALERKAQTQWF
jgi:RecA-family ATPase